MNKRQLYDALEKLAVESKILDSTNPMYGLCRDLFSRLGLINDFDPNDPQRTADALHNYEGVGKDNRDRVDEVLNEVVAEIAPGVEEEGAGMGTRSLNSQDLKVLLEEYDEHRALSEAARLKKIEDSPNLKGVARAEIRRAIDTKIRLEAEARARGATPMAADIQSDQIILAEERISEIAVADKLSEGQRWQTAEEVVRLAYEAKDVEEALSEAGKNKGLDVVTENRDELTRMVEEVRATIRTEERITSIAQSLANELEQNGVALTDDKRNRIIAAAKGSVERIVLEDPQRNIDDPIVEIRVEDEGLAHIVIEEPLTSKIGVIIGHRAMEEARTTVGIALSGADKAATDLFKPGAASTDVGGAKSHQISASLLKKGFSRADMEALRAMRFSTTSDGPKSIIEQEAAAVAEMHATEVARSKGFTEGQATKSSQEASVVTSLLKSTRTVKKNIEIVIINREKLAGIKEMKPAVDVVIKISKDPRLVQSVEMIRKLVHWQDRLDKMTGGLISKATGKVFEMTGFEGLKDFGIQLANKYGGEMVGAMATHIAQFGFEQGLRNILGQLLSTGTVTAVKAGATAASAATTAGAVAVDGAAAAAAGTGVGIPIALIILALQLAWAVGKTLLKSGEKVLVKVLQTLGIGSAKNVEDVKKFAGDMVKAGFVAGGVLIGVIMNLPAMLTGATMAMVGVIFVIVFSSLFGYNLLQTATTQISSLVSPKVDEGGGVCIKKTDIEGPSGGKLANCDAGKTGSVPGISQDAFVNLAERWSAGGGTNAARCYGAVVCAALAAGKDPTFVLWAWLHESGASNYSLGDIEDFGIHGQGPATNDFNAQIGSFLNLNPGYCSEQNGMDYWLGFATNYLTGTCDPNVAVGSNTGYTYLAEMQQTWSWVSGKPMPATANGSGGATCGGGGSSGGGDDEEDGGTQIDPETGEEYTCFGGGTLTSGSGPGFPRGTGAPTNGPSSPYPTRDPNIVIPPGCPMGWPVDGNMPVTQGSEGPTHGNIPGAAVDIMPTDASGNGSIGGKSIHVTHPGVVTYSGYSGGAYGNLVIVRGSCGGKNFVTYYAHLMDSQMVGMNQTLTMGQSIGLADNSGNYPVGNDHLHYEIRGCDSTSGGCYGASGFDPKAYLPQPVSDNCFWNCNVNTGP